MNLSLEILKKRKNKKRLIKKEEKYLWQVKRQ